MNGATILLVDDDPRNRKLARDLLTLHGHRVHEASSGEEALEQIGLRLFDLILLDLKLPGVDGYELARRLKSDASTRDIPLVALTASAMQGDEERVWEAGFDGYVTKPIDTRAFPSQVAGFLRRAQEKRVAAGR
ncbi:MAG: response regulator [Chloroflexi bacterium]|nr:response regulator [Chloroflexota bacterium]